jgi:hypothetical protein
VVRDCLYDGGAVLFAMHRLLTVSTVLADSASRPMIPKPTRAKDLGSRRLFDTQRGVQAQEGFLLKSWARAASRPSAIKIPVDAMLNRGIEFRNLLPFGGANRRFDTLR